MPLAVWKRIVLLALFLAAFSTQRLVAEEPKTPAPVVLPLTTFEVVNLANQGVSEEVIIRQLRETKTVLQLSPSDKQMLKTFGVTNRVILAMSTEVPETAPTPRDVPGKIMFVSDPAPVRKDTPTVIAVQMTSRTPASNRPVGTWVRQVGPARITLKFTEDRLVASATVADSEDEKSTMTFTLDADYSINPEGMVYGIITGIDSDNVEGTPEVQMLAGHPFAMRCRVDGNNLSIRDVKFLGSGLPKEIVGGAGEMSEMALFAAGRYTKNDNPNSSEPKKIKTASNETGSGGVYLKKEYHRRAEPQSAANPIPYPIQRTIVVTPDGQTIERLGVDFNNPVPPPPPMPQSLPIYSQPMVQYQPQGALLPPASAPMYAPQLAMPYAPHPIPVANGDVMIPAMAMAPAPMTMSTRAIGRSFNNRAVLGTWVREADPVRITLAFADERLTGTVDFPGDSSKKSMNFVAEYSVTPDGVLFGVISEIDANVLTQATRLQSLIGETFSCRFRSDGNTLSLMDAKFRGLEQLGIENGSQMLAGRYYVNVERSTSRGVEQAPVPRCVR